MLNAKEVRSPISSLSGTSLLHVRNGDIYLLAVTKQNVNACLVFEVLNKMVSILLSYFGGKFDEDQIRKNFVLIYELLDGLSQYLHDEHTPRGEREGEIDPLFLFCFSTSLHIQLCCSQRSWTMDIRRTLA